MSRYRKLTKAERKPRKAKLYSTFKDKEAWYYIGKSTTEFFAHVADGTVVRMTVGTRYLRNALNQMDKELALKVAIRDLDVATKSLNVYNNFQ